MGLLLAGRSLSSLVDPSVGFCSGSPYRGSENRGTLLGAPFKGILLYLGYKRATPISETRIIKGLPLFSETPIASGAIFGAPEP